MLTRIMSRERVEEKRSGRRRRNRENDTHISWCTTLRIWKEPMMDVPAKINRALVASRAALDTNRDAFPCLPLGPDVRIERLCYEPQRRMLQSVIVRSDGKLSGGSR